MSSIVIPGQSQNSGIDDILYNGGGNLISVDINSNITDYTDIPLHGYNDSYNRHYFKVVGQDDINTIETNGKNTGIFFRPKIKLTPFLNFDKIPRLVMIQLDINYTKPETNKKTVNIYIPFLYYANQYAINKTNIFNNNIQIFNTYLYYSDRFIMHFIGELSVQTKQAVLYINNLFNKFYQVYAKSSSYSSTDFFRSLELEFSIGYIY